MENNDFLWKMEVKKIQKGQKKVCSAVFRLVGRGTYFFYGWPEGPEIPVTKCMQLVMQQPDLCLG